LKSYGSSHTTILPLKFRHDVSGASILHKRPTFSIVGTVIEPVYSIFEKFEPEGGLKWSGKTGEGVKMYPTLNAEYGNDEEALFLTWVKLPWRLRTITWFGGGSESRYSVAVHRLH